MIRFTLNLILLVIPKFVEMFLSHISTRDTNLLLLKLNTLLYKQSSKSLNTLMSMVSIDEITSEKEKNLEKGL